MAGLTREQVSAAIEKRSREVVKVHVPEWDGDVYLRRMGTGDMESTGLLTGEVRIAAIVAASLCDEEGNLLFSEKEAAALEKADMAALGRIFAEAAKINGLTADELEGMTQAFGEAPLDGKSSD